MAGKGGGFFSMILLLGIAAVLVVLFMQDKPDTEMQLVNPEKALNFYLQAVWDHTHTDSNVHLRDIESVVREEDYQWFLKSHEAHFQDPMGIAAVADPTAMTATRKHAVMSQIIKRGPNRPDAQIVHKKIGPDTAVFKVRYLIDSTTDTYGLADVELVKVGKYWKVVDFAGGRSRMLGEAPPVTTVKGKQRWPRNTPAPDSGPSVF
ncbi:MAG: hypothetical protein ACOC29_04000 [Candidatus Sumerlaeota bacterium]